MSVHNTLPTEKTGSSAQGCTGMAVACEQSMGDLDSHNWYCVHTKPQREKHAGEQLSTLANVEVYFPRIRLQKTIRRVRKQVSEALFCRFDLTTQFRAVRYGHDVVDLVSFGTQPAIVANSLIQDLQSWVSENSLIAKSEFSTGDKVQIAAGPMQGPKAVILEGRSDQERVAVLRDILGSQARLTIDRRLLAKSA